MTIYILTTAAVIGLLAAAVVVLGVRLYRTHAAWLHERDRDRCQHDWKVTGGIYQQPRTSGTVTGFISSGMVSRMLFGFTTVTQQCSRCDKTDSFNTFGRASIPGYAWNK